MKLLVATNNPGKLDELAYLLLHSTIELTWLTKEGVNTAIEETGDSFYENAVLKARGYAAITGLPTLADDSGLEVDALGGKPGVMSARFAGPNATDNERNSIILQELRNVPWEQRTARFRAVIAACRAKGTLITSEGVLEGLISSEAEGSQGFGYDPILYLPEFGKTVAQLPLEVKNQISHRSRALRAILPKLEKVMKE